MDPVVNSARASFIGVASIRSEQKVVNNQDLVGEVKDFVIN